MTTAVRSHGHGCFSLGFSASGSPCAGCKRNFSVEQIFAPLIVAFAEQPH
jgi:hypothetical protein